MTSKDKSGDSLAVENNTTGKTMQAAGREAAFSTAPASTPAPKRGPVKQCLM